MISDLPRALTTLAHQGSKAYSQTFDLVHRREASGPNVIWQADHTELDIMLLREGKEPDRPWLTTVIDDYSRAIAGYYLSFDAPCALHTSLALRQAIWRKSVINMWTARLSAMRGARAERNHADKVFFSSLT